MSNRLPVLSSEIQRAHASALDASQRAAEYAIAAGAALIEAKELTKHGQWLPFLADVGIPPRTALRYMTLASSGIKSATVANLGIREAEEHIRLSRPMAPPEGQCAVFKDDTTMTMVFRKGDRFAIRQLDLASSEIGFTAKPIPQWLIATSLAALGVTGDENATVIADEQPFLELIADFEPIVWG